jgi:competence protein ComEC
MRAAIMGMLLLISFSAGRLYRVLPALAFSALVMLLLNPKILIWDVGFQLSFLATLGIVLLVPMLEDASRSLSAPTWLKSTLFATFAAIIATAPLIAFQFGRLSLIAPIANILVLPVIPIIMLFGFLTLLPFFGSGFGLLSKWLLEYVLFAVHYLSNVIYASIELHLDARSMLVCYVILGLAYALAYSYQKKAMSHD